MNKLEEQLDKMKNVQYRMEAEGFHYCFESYSSFEEVDDSEFHRLRLVYLEAAKLLETYVNKKVETLENEI